MANDKIFDVKALIEKGKQKGSLSNDDILEALGDFDIEIEQMEKLYEIIENAGIEITETINPDDFTDIDSNVDNAENAEIEVYDVMGRLVAIGNDEVAIENLNQNIFVVRTKYFDGQVFVTKVANR